MNGLLLLYWGGVTDIVTVGRNKLPATAEFTPFKVGCPELAIHVITDPQPKTSALANLISLLASAVVPLRQEVEVLSLRYPTTHLTTHIRRFRRLGRIRTNVSNGHSSGVSMGRRTPYRGILRCTSLRRW